MFGRSPETTLAGVGAFVGLVLVVIGLLFKEAVVWQSGLTVVSAATAAIGLFARSESQHLRDKTEGKT